MILSEQLSKDFTLSEFTKLSKEGIPDVQGYLLTHLVSNILQPIRDYLGCSIKVTSGIRSIQDFQRLQNDGHNPSETSDHYYGTPVPISNPEKLRRFGPLYCCSVGAADIIPSCGVNTAFNKLLTKVKIENGMPYFDINNKPFFGQLIHEYGKGSEWLHISNPPTVMYSLCFSPIYLSRPSVLVSLDGGKTYTIVTPKQ